jgi:hypothetical protein
MNTTELKSVCVKLHLDMQEKLLANCQNLQVPLPEKCEKAIWICENYIEKLYGQVPERMDGPAQEILFFKTIKPLLVAEREYHQRQYYACLFGTGADLFWKWELERMKDLLEAHAVFSDYYRQGYDHHDAEWFCQHESPEPTMLCLQPMEPKGAHTSKRDGWVGGLLAVERYKEWLIAKVSTQSFK